MQLKTTSSFLGKRELRKGAVVRTTEGEVLQLMFLQYLVTEQRLVKFQNIQEL